MVTPGSKTEAESSRRPEQLIEQARQARLRAYCPYSRFAVGAAALTAEGDVFTGCNIENSAYSDAVCAERVAIFKAVSEGSRHITAIAVVAAGIDPPRPCGSCLQVIAEFAPKATIYLGTPDGAYEQTTLPALLPEPFRLKQPGEELAGGGLR
jgi:cytidine deaminase